MYIYEYAYLCKTFEVNIQYMWCLCHTTIDKILSLTSVCVHVALERGRLL